MIGAVLCGGESRRMGRPKALLPWHGGDLLDHALRRVAAAGLEPVCLGSQKWARRDSARTLPDAVPGAGPLGGVLAALHAGDSFVFAVDMPLLTADEMRAITQYGEASGRVTLPAWEGNLQALCGYWPRSAAAALDQYLMDGRRKVIDFAEMVPHRYLDEDALREIGVDPQHLRGMNTPEEYAVLRAAAGLGEEERP